MIELNLKEEDKTTKCKGLFWRASINIYLSSFNSIEERKSLRLLKRLSCKGCPVCDWELEYIKEDIENTDDMLKDLKHGKLYSYKIHSFQGYYDSYPEIDYTEFIEIKENDR